MNFFWSKSLKSFNRGMDEDQCWMKLYAHQIFGGYFYIKNAFKVNIEHWRIVEVTCEN
jgi:hypothetical protein